MDRPLGASIKTALSWLFFEKFFNHGFALLVKLYLARLLLPKHTALLVWPAAAQKYPFLDTRKVKKFVQRIGTERICSLLWRLIVFDIWATKYNVEL